LALERIDLIRATALAGDPAKFEKPMRPKEPALAWTAAMQSRSMEEAGPVVKWKNCSRASDAEDPSTAADDHPKSSAEASLPSAFVSFDDTPEHVVGSVAAESSPGGELLPFSNAGSIGSIRTNFPPY